MEKALFQRKDVMFLEEKNVLITGGARRVGAELVRRFAAAGARVAIHCRNSRAEAEQLLTSLAQSDRHRIFCADLARPGEAERLFAAVGRVDVLVNNASLYRAGRLAAGSEAGDRLHFEVNFWSPLALMRAFAAQEELTEGCVVNLLDQETAIETPQGGGYALSRRALRDATLAFARELGPRNLRFNGVCPGPVLPPVGLEHSRMEKTLPTLPLRRKVDLGELADAVLFLCRMDSITGELLYVDCGQHLLAFPDREK